MIRFKSPIITVANTIAASTRLQAAYRNSYLVRIKLFQTGDFDCTEEIFGMYAKVRDILRQAGQGRTRVSMNKINLIEVYYDDYRTHGSAAAAIMLEKIKRTPITVIPYISIETTESM